jgi:predicted regulator of Ras-like GTPase activity (Roadblock/LC7/MglB family)
MSAPATNSSSTLRFRQIPIAKVRLRITDLAAFVAAQHLQRELPEEEFIEIDAHSSLAHIVPRISIRALAKVRPDLFLPVDEFVKLPTHRIATAYRMGEESYEPIDEFSPESKSSTAAGHDFISAAQNLARLSKTQILSDSEPAPEAGEAPLAPPAPVQPPPSADQPQRLIELIHSLPTFHRFAPAPPSPDLIEPLILETENTGTDLPDQETLQAIFLTEEKLTVRRVLELCGELPGIRSCVLSCDDAVVASHNVPENFDLVGMSSTASKMLSAMQESSSQLGIGAVPALTLHTERGPLSIVQNNRLTLLVVHADRGFIPGVREKLTATLGELSRMPLALPSAAVSSGGMPLPHAAE